MYERWLGAAFIARRNSSSVAFSGLGCTSLRGNHHFKAEKKMLVQPKSREIGNYFWQSL
jgi:hypothetical protein